MIDLDFWSFAGMRGNAQEVAIRAGADDAALNAQWQGITRRIRFIGRARSVHLRLQPGIKGVVRQHLQGCLHFSRDKLDTPLPPLDASK
jgi:hypothetical protein